MNVDPDTTKTLLQIFNMLGTLAIGVWLYLEKRNDKTNDRVDRVAAAVTKLEREVDDRLDDMAPRLRAVETRIESAPTHDDLAAIHEKINGVSKELAKLSGNVDGMSRLLNSIDDYLRNHK